VIGKRLYRASAVQLQPGTCGPRFGSSLAVSCHVAGFSGSLSDDGGRKNNNEGFNGFLKTTMKESLGGPWAAVWEPIDAPDTRATCAKGFVAIRDCTRT
jgi:hypothetical protein